MTFPKQTIRLDLATFHDVGNFLLGYLKAGTILRLDVKEWTDKRSLNQNALSHMWYAEISRFLMARGRHKATPEWVKDAMKHTYLGYQDIERVDLITGAVTTVQELRHTSDLATGEMHRFLCNVEGWAREIGCLVTIPGDCEFMQLRHQQNQ